MNKGRVEVTSLCFLCDITVYGVCAHECADLHAHVCAQRSKDDVKCPILSPYSGGRLSARKPQQPPVSVSCPHSAGVTGTKGQT